MDSCTGWTCYSWLFLAIRAMLVLPYSVFWMATQTLCVSLSRQILPTRSRTMGTSPFQAYQVVSCALICKEWQALYRNRSALVPQCPYYTWETAPAIRFRYIGITPNTHTRSTRRRECIGMIVHVVSLATCSSIPSDVPPKHNSF